MTSSFSLDPSSITHFYHAIVIFPNYIVEALGQLFLPSWHVEWPQYDQNANREYEQALSRSMARVVRDIERPTSQELPSSRQLFSTII